MNELTKERKHRLLSKMYFSVSDSSTHDVNPYEDLPTFLKAKVKSMQWGVDKKASKERFCSKFLQILNLYEIEIPEQSIMNALNKNDVSNRDIVNEWVEIAIFTKASLVKKSA